MDEKRMATSQFGRAARLGGLAAWSAARSAGTKTANVARSAENSEIADRKAMVATAERMVTVLGSMRGAAMKMGQTLSMFEFGILDDETRIAFQSKLAALQDQAPRVAFVKMRRVIETDLGGPLDTFFAEFDESAIAAASIGQVYRARLHDGREVAVKVQYPGIEQAVRGDMKSVGLLLKAFSRIAPGIDSKELGDELIDRIGDELDYELEASNQHALARAYRDHPLIVVPDVVADLCGRRVLVSEFVHARSFKEVLGESKEFRDRAGEIIARFYLVDPHRHGLLNGDPHPGNCLFLDDGRIAFLDFGFFKRVSREESDGQQELIRAILAGDRRSLFDISLAANAISNEPGQIDAFWSKAEQALGWLMRDEQVTLDIAQLNSTMTAYTSLSAVFETFNVPPREAVRVRVLGLVLAVLGQLEATANWHRIAAELVHDAAPESEIGHVDATYWGDLRVTAH
ncbi:ABC1 kinase family protein [Nocardia sp. NBC_01388]|uniref:ABC1 kinase family protein n=1 Tax=Nocardia sp. NBC_01388 TaxID=2903596 RepID=UPI00324D87C8